MPRFSTLEYLQRQIDGTLPEGATCPFLYPTATSRLAGHRITEVGEGYACLMMDVNPAKYGNQQGTVHGGMLCELADAAMGTAQSTLVPEGHTFASIDLSIKFFRPVWTTTLTAKARPVQVGKKVVHYGCEIRNAEGKAVAMASGTFMILPGDMAEKG